MALKRGIDKAVHAVVEALTRPAPEKPAGGASSETGESGKSEG